VVNQLKLKHNNFTLLNTVSSFSPLVSTLYVHSTNENQYELCMESLGHRCNYILNSGIYCLLFCEAGHLVHALISESGSSCHSYENTII